MVPQAAYVQRTVWPLTVRRKVALPPRRGGKVLVVRDLTAGPGLDQRGVQWLLPNGSLHVDYYNQWAVPPAEGVTDDLRRWLADSGLFAAVVGPDSGVAGDYCAGGGTDGAAWAIPRRAGAGGAGAGADPAAGRGRRKC